MPVQSTHNEISCAPAVSLPDLEGVTQSLAQLSAGAISVVFFSCNHCPYVQWIEQEVGRLAHELSSVSWIAICSNDTNNYPEDNVAGLLDQRDRAQWNFPYLIDSDQNVAHQFGAVCTPDFFVFAPDSTLIYRGAFDSSRPNSDIVITGEYLRAAVECADQGTTFTGGAPSLGCGIKWSELGG